MIMKSFGLLFYLKKRSGYVSGDLPIYMRITVDGVSKEISLLRMCDPARWNPVTARMVGAKETVRALNAYLDTLQAKVYEAKHMLIQNGKPVTAEFIKNLVQGREVQSEPARMSTVIFQHHNDQMAALVGREYAPGTLVRFKTALKHTRDFLLWKYKVPDIDIKKLDYEFVSEFEFWFKSEKKCDHNTTIKYIACCKKIVLRCIHNGWLQRNPFMGFNMALREVDRDALTEEELQTMAGKQFPSDRLTSVRDIFLFSCFTGLAYADVKKLKRTEISTGIDGDKWIFTKRKKTDTPSRIPILPMALEILQRYEDHPACQVKGMVLPILTNQKMNAYLKEIADVCGIHKNLTFHIARHTFATTVTLSNGVPIETVSKILGHRSLRTTQHYAKILDRKVSQDMQALKEKLSFKVFLGGEQEKKL
jgi:site-specific recombinase XerD